MEAQDSTMADVSSNPGAPAVGWGSSQGHTIFGILPDVGTLE